MIPADTAWQTILAHARQLDPTRVSLATALGRTLRTDACADADSPPFDASAMDGYALRRADIAAPLRVIGTSQAGAAFTAPVATNQCVRIFTGAPVPADADCVVKQEDVSREGDVVRITNKNSGPDFIRRRGENRRSGDIVVPAGTRLGPPELSALASAGVTQPAVTRAPRCVHLVTGNELVAPDQTPAGAQIRDSNSTLIAALLQQHGAELIAQTRVPDDLTAARATVESLPTHDLLLISGGASVGDYDIARPLLEALGFTLHFQQINLRPGKPLVFASRGQQLAFALPGNPVSHWVVFQLFLAPLLKFLQSGLPAPPERLIGQLAANTRLPPPDARQTFWPSRALLVDGRYEITPLPLASSGDSSGLVGANALLPVPPPPGNFTAGQSVEFIYCP
jgi:molybdopterin molybdotransferase